MSETKEVIAKEGDVLDELRKIDKAIKAKLLIEKLAQLKKIARQINELREETTVSLEELGLTKADIKRVIDYINESPGVKLTKADKEEIRDRVRNEGEEEREKVEEKVKDIDISRLQEMFKLGNASTGGTSGLGWSGANAIGHDLLYRGNGGGVGDVVMCSLAYDNGNMNLLLAGGNDEVVSLKM